MRTCRQEVARLQGKNFARALAIVALDDLARFVLDCDACRRSTAWDWSDATQALQRALLAGDAPLRFLTYVRGAAGHTMCTAAHHACSDLSPIHAHSIAADDDDTTRGGHVSSAQTSCVVLV